MEYQELPSWGGYTGIKINGINYYVRGDSILVERDFQDLSLPTKSELKTFYVFADIKGIDVDNLQGSLDSLLISSRQRLEDFMDRLL